MASDCFRNIGNLVMAEGRKRRETKGVIFRPREIQLNVFRVTVQTRRGG